MKYSLFEANVQAMYERGVKFYVCCSQCDTSVAFEDKFCRECGHKLIKLPEYTTIGNACQILTNGMKVQPTTYEDVL